MRAFVFLGAIALAATSGCSRPAPARELDHDLIRVTSDARLRTDTVGEGKWAEQATFVLAIAENTSKEGAYVTLAGELVDPSNARLGDLRAQSMWIPAGEQRTFALVDGAHKAQPNAKGAAIYVRGARVGAPPPAHVASVRTVMDGDKAVVQGVLENEAARPGTLQVVATFFAPDGRPMTRPFSVLWVDAKGGLPVQFVGPRGSTKATLVVGDVAY
jgi:hypothetical protein